MTSPIFVKTPTDTCRHYLDQLGWSWKHERITDWLIRVQQHYTGSLWNYGEPVPEFVKESLARFLEYRFKCQCYLKALGWDWSHPKILKVEEQFGTPGKLPLKGYKYLLGILEAEDPIHF